MSELIEILFFFSWGWIGENLSKDLVPVFMLPFTQAWINAQHCPGCTAGTGTLQDTRTCVVQHPGLARSSWSGAGLNASTADLTYKKQCSLLGSDPTAFVGGSAHVSAHCKHSHPATFQCCSTPPSFSLAE